MSVRIVAPVIFPLLSVKKLQTSDLRARHLPGRYQLAQFHAHWGQDASCGSEHHLDGMAMSGEVHFVFWNTKYRNLERAMEYGEGLAVLGVFLKVRNPKIQSKK